MAKYIDLKVSTIVFSVYVFISCHSPENPTCINSIYTEKREGGGTP